MLVREAIIDPVNAWGGDDALGWMTNEKVLQLWAVDGATSVSERPDRVRTGLPDPAWFARHISNGIVRSGRYGELTKDRLARIIRPLEERWMVAVNADAKPYDPPVAALAYASIGRKGNGWTIRTLLYADCFVLAIPLLDPRLTTPAGFGCRQPVRGSLPRSAEILSILRARRAEQLSHGPKAGDALTLRPTSVADGREVVSYLPRRHPWVVLVGTDGFARLWEEYALDTCEIIAARTVRYGLRALVRELRAWEKSNPSHGRNVKAADDASVLVALLESTEPAAAVLPPKRSCDGAVHVVGPNSFGVLP